MRARLIPAAAVFLAATCLTSPAHADYGPGSMSYVEWLGLHSGETITNVQAACGCSGSWANNPGMNPKVIWYDNTVSGGRVEEWYVYQDGHWRTFTSKWCSTSCQRDF